MKYTEPTKKNLIQTILPEHEEKQNKFRALRNRQDLFQEEGILNLILEAIDKINVITSQGFLAGFLAGDESGQSWEMISGYLYQLLGKNLLLIWIFYVIASIWEVCTLFGCTQNFIFHLFL